MITQTEAYTIVKTQFPPLKNKPSQVQPVNGEEKRAEQTEGMLQDGSEGRDPHYNSAVLHFSSNPPGGIQSPIKSVVSFMKFHCQR